MLSEQEKERRWKEMVDSNLKRMGDVRKGLGGHRKEKGGGRREELVSDLKAFMILLAFWIGLFITVEIIGNL